ncbi:metalloendopeptidase, partial [Novosphingobium sp. 1949]|nr:metalloendopeptidase [Novosphingobium organovorum]
MKRPAPRPMIASLAVFAAAAIGAGHALSQGQDFALLAPGVDAAQAQRQILAARREADEARTRAEALERRAREVTQNAQKTAREAAALAARIQENEASIAAQEGQADLISARRATLRERLARRQGPLARLTGA